MLPKANRTSRKHHPALPYAELPAFMLDLRALAGIPARALEFTILTAARTGEAQFARGREFDLAGSVWTIPGERMKGEKEHGCPSRVGRWRSCASFHVTAMRCSAAVATAGS